MAQLLRLASGSDRSPVRREIVPRSNEPRHPAASPLTDLDLARISKANVFVVGTAEEAAKVVTSLWPSLFTPVLVRRRGEPLQLSAPDSPVSTMIVYDVDTLTRHEQDALSEWLGLAQGRARVVSSASRPLLAAVEAGEFNDSLYYRLNVLTIHL